MLPGAVNVVAPLIAPNVAVTSVKPTLALVARPVALMLATEGADDDHATELVRSSVLPFV